MVATGTEPLTYQWYEGASGDITNPIAGATGSSYTTPPLTHNTQYWVRVSNGFGSISGDFTFDTVKLAVSGPVGRPNTTFFFDDFFFDGAVSDNFDGPAISPLWTTTQQNGTINLSSEQSHSGSQSVRFTSSSDGQRDIGLTHTFPQATMGTVSTWFYDSAAGTESLNAGLYAFHSARSTNAFGVSVAEWDGSTWVWRGPGVGDTATSLARSPGWHQLKLEITATGFNAFVDNNPISNGSVNSETATITVGIAPVITAITTQPQSPSILPPGQTATISVLATGTEPLNYEWSVVTGANTRTLIEGANASSYTTPPLFMDVTYSVRVSNAFGAPSSTVTIPVLGAPVITTQPVSQMIPAGSSVTLTVTARGAEPLTYQWYLGTSGDMTHPIQGATENRYAITPTPTETTAYWVQVSSNGYGSTNSMTAIISVPTIIAIGPKGGSGECTTDGITPVTVIWEGIEPSATDYFALYPLGVPDNAPPLQTWLTGGTSADSYIVTLPGGLAPGPYVFRLFGRDGQRLAESNTFYVTAPAPMIAVSPQTVETTGALTLTWHGIAVPAPEARFVLVVPGGSNYVTQESTGGAASGTTLMRLPASIHPGLYEVRLLADNSDEHLLATSQIVTVTGPLGVGPVVIASPPSVLVGSSLLVTWKTVKSPTTADWFAIVRTDLPDSEYVTGSASYTGGTVDGELRVPLPRDLALGLYEVRLFAGNGTRLVKSNAFIADVNHAPSLTKGADQAVLEDSGPTTIAGWATNISAGSAYESGQILDFIVSNNNSALFSFQPAITPDGTLTFTPMASATGSAIVTIRLHDNGGVVNGGVDTSAAQTFAINVIDVISTLTLPTEIVRTNGAVINMSVLYASHGASVSGLQFDLQYDRSVLSIGWKAGTATTSANKVLSTNVLQNGDTRYLIAGLNQTIFPDGIVVDLTIHVSPEASAGSYTLRFVNLAATDPFGDGRTLQAHDGQVIVADTTGPVISLASPAKNANYALNQVVTASYTCSDSAGVASCTGPVASGDTIDTSVAGTFTFTVTASDILGNTATEAVGYRVLEGPTVMVTSPNEPIYERGSTLLAQYVCGNAVTCVGDVPNETVLDTSEPGVKSLTITATDAAGNITTVTVIYVVSLGACVLPFDGLTAWLPGDGTAEDLVTKTPATWAGTAAYAPGGVQHAFAFTNGSVVSLPFQQAGMFTLQAWIRTPDRFQPFSGVLATSQPGQLQGLSFQIELDAGNYWLRAGNSEVLWLIGPATDSFQHVAVTFDTAISTLAVYLNGRLVQSDLWTGAEGLGFQVLTLGIDRDRTSAFTGMIDEVQVFNRALPAEDIYQTFLAGRDGLCKNRPPTAVASAAPNPAEAMHPAGAMVTLDGTGSTDPDGDALTYTWREGTTPLGSGATLSVTLSIDTAVNSSHVITLTVEDGRGGTSTSEITVVVRDTTPPTLTGVPGEMTREATSAAGAIASWTATAVDLVDGIVPVVCAPASGSTFPLHTTVVTCSATDARDNHASKSFIVTVRDTTPPTLQITSPSPDALLMSSTVDVVVQASDLVGVSGVTVNGVAATRTAGTPQAGTWRATVAITLPVAAGGALPFDACATDAAGRTGMVTLFIDNDAIPAALDRARSNGVDESSYSSDEFNNNITAGTLTRNGWTVKVSNAPTAGGVRATVYGAGAIARISACIGAAKEVRLDALGETADVTCNPTTGTITVRAVSSVPQIELREHLANGVWQQFNLHTGQSMSVGSPATVSAENAQPIIADLLMIDAKGRETIVGRYQLAPGASVDVTAPPVAAGQDPTLRFEVLKGRVSVTLNGRTQTIRPGAPIVMPVDRMPPRRRHD